MNLAEDEWLERLLRHENGIIRLLCQEMVNFFCKGTDDKYCRAT